MRGICLLAVLLLAKVLMLAGQPWTLTAWTPAAWFSHDVLAAATFWLADAVFARPRLGWIAYALAVIYVALNVPIAAAVGSPLTLAMIDAARGPLADSVLHYVTWGNGARMAAVAFVGVALPVVWLRRRAFRTRPVAWPERLAVVAACAAAALVGPPAVARVDTRGLHRNAFTALVPAQLPRITAAPVSTDWRASPMPAAVDVAVDLARYRGAAAGMNVLLVVLESTGARYLQPYGAAWNPMPNLTALGRRALLFENAYAAYPESIKGLLAMLCSRHPAFNQTAEAQASRPCESIARTLREIGYRTALFHSGRFGYLGMEAVVSGRGFDDLEDAGDIGGNRRSSFGVDEPATVGRMLDWIDSLGAGRRFFLTYLPIAGHHPYATPGPGPFRGDGDFAQYLNALSHADEALGLLLTGLRSRGLDDRTLVVVFGDHGEAFGQHAGNTGHSLFIHDENLRVPYLIAIPGLSSTIRVPGVASLVDTAPTILDLLGLRPARRHQGTSLLQPGSRMALFLADYSLGWLGLRDACWKYQFETGSGRSALFDVCADPGETRNLAGREPARVRAYRRHVEQWSRRDALFTRSGPSP